MAAVKINAETGTEMHAAIVALLKDRRKVQAGKLAPADWSARAAALLAQHGKSLWQ